MIPREEAAASLGGWAEYWAHWANALFLAGYLETAGAAPFLPESRDDLGLLLRFYLLERALTELRDELDNRLDWVRIPTHGLLEILDAGCSPSIVPT